MSRGSRHRSYTERLFALRRRRAAAGRIVLIIIALAILRAFFFQVYRLGDERMAPSLRTGDIVLVFPGFDGPSTLFGKLPAISPPDRGRLVIAYPERPPDVTWLYLAWDSLARFFTLQRYSPFEHRYGKALSEPVLARVIGLPGDTLRGARTGFSIKASGASEFVSEFALSKYPYSLTSGTTYPEIKLGSNEYFLACDDRSMPAASTLKGPISSKSIHGRVVLLFWPLQRLGLK